LEQLSAIFVRSRLLAIHCLIVVVGSSAFAQGLRRLTLDDLFAIETIGDVAVSPNGRTIAYVQRRPRSSARSVKLAVWMQGNDRADVWLVPITGGSPTRITDGVSDGSGFWEPKWSPDGAHIAMLSTRGNNVRLWLWEKATGRLIKLSDKGISRALAGLGVFEHKFGFGWLDAHRLVAFLLPEGARTHPDFVIQDAGALATRGWNNAWSGKESTNSTLESGVPADMNSRPRQQAVVFTLGEAPRVVGDGVELQDLQVSSDGNYLAFIRQSVLLRPEPDRPLPGRPRSADNRVGFYFARHQLTVTGADGSKVFEQAPGDGFVVYGSFRWARSGHRFAFLGARAGDGDDSTRLFLGEVGHAVIEISLPGLDPKQFIWLDGETLLVPAEANQRTDLWLVSSDKAPMNLTATMRVPPSNLHLLGHFLVGLADGELWKLNLASMTWVKLATTSKVSRFASVPSEPNYSSIIVELSNEVKKYYSLDLSTDRFIPIIRPSVEATLVAYSPITEAAVFISTERTGTSLAIVQRGQQPRYIIRLNGFLNEIAEGETRPFEYRGLDGQQLVGWLLLPPRNRTGTRLPLVTWVYPSRRYSREAEPGLLNINEDIFINLQLLAARGYAVMLPSMPLPGLFESKTAIDMNLELTKGVLPAIDRVIDMGIADPRRVALMGHSWGGFATYGLITQTSRFKAAIAIAGFSDLVSLYNSVIPRWRYFSYTDEAPFPYGQVMLEGLYRMDNPPWKDLGRYLRNSPITNVDRVQTPLLIIHGDMDHVPIEQAEEFFNALYRQGKRARFVRYWGEWHFIDSPANIRNMWIQIYTWLDEFCDISRDEKGELIFDGDHVKSRNGALPLKREDFARFNEIELRSHPWVRKTEAGDQRWEKKRR